MGYDIHITRRKHWSAEGEPQINFDEWKTIVNSDPQLEPVGGTGQEESTIMMCDESRRAARYFYYSDGQVFVKKPCTAVLMKMLAIAQKLNAQVMGDDEEVYAPDGTPSHKAQFEVTDRW